MKWLERNFCAAADGRASCDDGFHLEIEIEFNLLSRDWMMAFAKLGWPTDG